MRLISTGLLFPSLARRFQDAMNISSYSDQVVCSKLSILGLLIIVLGFLRIPFLSLGKR
jgi:hypothetical protein